MLNNSWSSSFWFLPQNSKSSSNRSSLSTEKWLVERWVESLGMFFIVFVSLAVVPRDWDWCFGVLEWMIGVWEWGWLGCLRCWSCSCSKISSSRNWIQKRHIHIMDRQMNKMDELKQKWTNWPCLLYSSLTSSGNAECRQFTSPRRAELCKTDHTTLSSLTYLHWTFNNSYSCYWV